MERSLPKRDRRWSDPYLPLRPTELVPCLGVGPELMNQWDCLGGGATPTCCADCTQGDEFAKLFIILFVVCSTSYYYLLFCLPLQLYS